MAVVATVTTVVWVTLGVAVFLLGVADAVLIWMGLPIGPPHDAIILVFAGSFFVIVGLVKKYARDDIKISFILAGASVAVWSSLASVMVARLIVENWYFVLAAALAQSPIVKICIYKTYGDRLRSIVVDRMKEVGPLNDHKTRIAKRLASQLPVEESAVYAIQASAIATAVFMNELGFTANSATTAASIFATITGTVFYTFHSGVEEMRAFRENPRDFF